MSLLSEAMTDCVFLNKSKVSDGEGGFVVEWTEGASFKAAIVFDNSMEARTAEKAGVTSLYTVSVPISVAIEYHDVFKRLSDGKIFRATSPSSRGRGLKYQSTLRNPLTTASPSSRGRGLK